MSGNTPRANWPQLDNLKGDIVEAVQGLVRSDEVWDDVYTRLPQFRAEVADHDESQQAESWFDDLFYPIGIESYSLFKAACATEEELDRKDLCLHSTFH